MSRVVPGKSEVIAESLPDKKLISVDFPAFVGPAITINGAQSSALPFFALINILSNKTKHSLMFFCIGKMSKLTS